MADDASSTHRRRNAQATRDAIVDAARCRFAREGYDRAGLREIAADAGVDAALVSRYFGGKHELFTAVLALSANPEELFYGPPAESAARLAEMMVRGPQDDSKLDCLLIMMRSASSPCAADAVRRIGEERFYGPMAAWLGGEDRAVAARLLGALMMGMGVARAITADFHLDEAGLLRLRRYIEAIVGAVAGGGLAQPPAEPLMRRPAPTPMARS